MIVSRYPEGPLSSLNSGRDGGLSPLLATPSVSTQLTRRPERLARRSRFVERRGTSGKLSGQRVPVVTNARVEDGEDESGAGIHAGGLRGAGGRCAAPRL